MNHRRILGRNIRQDLWELGQCLELRHLTLRGCPVAPSVRSKAWLQLREAPKVGGALSGNHPKTMGKWMVYGKVVGKIFGDLDISPFCWVENEDF